VIGQDLRGAVKAILARPASSLTAIIALALAIGANTAIFSVVDAVLLRSLPYHDPGKLVWICENNLTSNIAQEPVSYPDFIDWSDQSASFQDLAAFGGWFPILTGAGEPERLPAALVSPGLFQLLGAQPVEGRTFLPDEDQPGKTSVVLSYNLWRRRFGSEKNVIGKTIILNGNAYQVIGVMPASFQYPSPGDSESVELWGPLPASLKSAGRRSDFLTVVGRLKPAISIAQASSELGILANRLATQYPDTNAGWGVTVIPLYERFTGDVRPAMLVLAIAVSLLLLIACANLANLLLVRATARRREIAIRKALGATRRRLIRQFLTESCVLALVGGAVGLILAPLGIRALVSVSPSGIPRLNHASVDIRVLAFSVALSLITGFIFGFAPAIQASRTDLNEELKEGGRTSTGGVTGRRIRGVLLITEVALVLALLIGSALMIKSFARLQEVDLGFDAERLLTLELALPRQKYKEPHQAASFVRDVIQQVGALPGVQEVASVLTVPLSGKLQILDFGIEGSPPLPPGQVNDAESQVVSPSYFHTMSIPLLRGRLFTREDSTDSALAIIINDALAKRYFPDEDPLGRRLTLEDPAAGHWLTIIGIVGNVHQSGVDRQPYPQIYTVNEQNPQWATALVVKTALDPTKLIEPIRDEVASVDPGQPLYHVRTMADVISGSLSRQRFNAELISILTAVAFLLTVIGIYGVVSYIITHRFNEIGIRVAMGAGKGQILGMVLWEGSKLALIGIVIGLGAAFLLVRLMSSLLFGISPTDTTIFIGIPLLLAAVVVAACCIPALKALAIDPVAALRYE
jgi:putative ABC transport system permease protein